MVTIKNYFDEISKIDPSSLPAALKHGHDLLADATENGENWENYYDNEEIQRTVDLYINKLNEFLKKEQPNFPDPSGKKDRVEPPVKPAKKKVSAGSHKQTSKKQPTSDRQEEESRYHIELVERIPEELRFIRRFVNLNGKKKSKDEILRFINSLQKAIVEKRIRKTSAYAEQISFIQDKLIEVYNSMGATIDVKLKPETHEALKKVAGEQKVLASINFIKRYIGMNGKPRMKEKAKQLLAQINRAIDKGKITDSDSYILEIHEIKKNLKAFTEDKAHKVLEIEKATLNGLQGILGCDCKGLNGPTSVPTMMNSVDFVQMDFPSLGLKGKWFNLIGDPSPNFTAMVYGKPKQGKSYLCVEFAGYLARNHGKVLYVAKEEGLDTTLQKKLRDKNIAHPNLIVASILPDSLGSFDFIFLDSVTRLGLSPDDLHKLRADYPKQAFIFVFQTTKDGNFRGANAFQHDVDVVIEVREGKAFQYGRFNQGGEMGIF